VKADEAALETARLDLGWTRVHLACGRGGGNRAGANWRPRGAIRPFIDDCFHSGSDQGLFQANEQSYLSFWQKYISTMDTNSRDVKPRVETFRRFGPTPGKEDFYSADRQESGATTGTMQIVAVFPNPDAILRPGPNTPRCEPLTRLQTNVFLLPQRAVQEVQGAYEVASSLPKATGATNVAHLRHVKVGRQIGPNWIVEEGLEAGDLVWWRAR